ncbi:MAG: TolC family protein [Bacteriovoracaceae bacterium]|nr:TolC family protein [Bacteriovoracaceae bacterium]
MDKKNRFSQFAFHVLLLLLFFFDLPRGFSKSYELKELIEKAKSLNLDILVAEMSSKITHAQKEEAKSSIYPTLRLESSFVEVEKRTAFGSGNPDRTLENVRLVANQRIFRGLGEFHELGRLGQLEEAQKQFYESTKRDVATSLLDFVAEVMWQKARLKRQKELLELSKEREATLDARVRIGKSRQSELLNAKSQTSSVLAQMAPIQQALDSAIISLKNFSQVEDLTDIEEPKVLPKIEDQQVGLDAKELDLHPGLLSLEHQIAAFEQESKVNKAYHFPQIDVRANIYGKRADVSFEGSDWDIGLFITWPLFEGNIVAARNQQVYARRNQSLLQKSRQRNLLHQNADIQSKSFLNAKIAFAEASKSASLQKSSYESLKKDYQLGLANNLEVNQSLNLYIQNLLLIDQAKISLVKSVFQYYALLGRTP